MTEIEFINNLKTNDIVKIMAEYKRTFGVRLTSDKYIEIKEKEERDDYSNWIMVK